MGESAKKLTWQNLALMAFVMVWGFGNVVTNYANQGLAVVTSWIIMFSLYFIPYALMVGELGAEFKDSQGGVSSWIKSTNGAKLAYLAGWTYWVVHIPYLAQKPQGVLIACSWIFKQNGDMIKAMDPIILQSIALAVFLFFVWVASKGITSLKRIGTIAGTAMLVMSILYILLMMGAPAIAGIKPATANISLKSFIPTFDFRYFTTISMLVFAVGGAEKISPYVNNTKNPSKDFPKGMIALAVMVAVSAILGSIAMGWMFDSANLPDDLKMNGSYYAFKLLGEYYGVGSLLLIIYAIANVAAQVSALIFSIDAPLKVLLGDGDKNFIPKSLTKVNKYGAPINGYKMVTVLVGILIIIPALGIGDMNTLFNWLLDLNSVVMPMRYLWVFFAYMMLKTKFKNSGTSDYKFLKNNKAGFIVGLWCFAFTAFACIMGIFPKGIDAFTGEWYFQIALNILTPFVLMGLGLILPSIAKKTNHEDDHKQRKIA
jgi:amino acid transporter